MTTINEYPVIWNEKTQRVEPVHVIIHINDRRLAELAARKALHNKKGRTSLMFGAVKVEVRR